MIVQKTDERTPGLTLHRKVRIAFIDQGTTFHAWCLSNEIDPKNARMAIVGGWNGPKGQALRRRILYAAGLIKQEVA